MFLSSGETDNGFLKVRLPRNVSSIGAMITIELEDGKRLYRPFVAGEGLVSDSSHVIIAGLEARQAVPVGAEVLA